MQSIVDRSASGVYKNKPAARFDFEQIALAHKMMEENRACGKIVVTV
jgi:NADPH:quinone reductase-like Zn-dependent oxidoreductase